MRPLRWRGTHWTPTWSAPLKTLLNREGEHQCASRNCRRATQSMSGAARPSLFKQLTQTDLQCPPQPEAPFSVLPMRVCCHVGWHTL
jgi:hypothetical protein